MTANLTNPSAEAGRLRLRKLLAHYATDPLVRLLASLGVTPNGLTYLGLAASGGAAALLATGHLVAGGALVLGGSAFDLLDGALARATGKATKFGAFLDSTTDRLAEGVILFGLLVHFARAEATEEVLLIFCAMVAGVLVSYVKARAEALGLSCNIGLVTRPERVVLLGFGLLIDQVTILLYIIAIASFFTAVHRFLHSSRQALRS
ncbi:MAG: CDP-alcohol phosphatidyltransferase family protein [Candidatus Methylomirabilales bacterium]